MSSLQSACKRLGVLACAGAISMSAHGQAKFGIEGGEYPIVGSLPGDQVFPQLALNPYGGYIVWQDNATDGDGFGISARRVNRSLSGSLSVFRVNEAGVGDQVNAQVALLSNGGAVFAWQSSIGAVDKVIIRLLKADGTFATGDVSVSATGNRQVTPVVTGLPDGNALVVWASDGPDGSMLGVFGAIFSPTGEKKVAEFQVNQRTLYNQRSPAVALLPNGNALIAWVSESYKGTAQNQDATGAADPFAGAEVFNADVYARLIKPGGESVGGEFKANRESTICANPCISPSTDGFLVAWSGKPSQISVATQLGDGWDIYARLFALDGTANSADVKVNSYTPHDQYGPRASWLNGAHMLLWTSVDQDGSREGVVGRLLSAVGEAVSREFRINSTTVGQQLYPAIATTGSQNFLAVWSNYIGGAGRFDLFGQRYSVTAEPSVVALPAPYVSAIGQSRLSVTWPQLTGYTGVEYLVYADNNPAPIPVAGTQWTASGLLPASTHSFRVAYKLADGTQSNPSDAATGRTWNEDGNFDGLPDDWQTQFWGSNSAAWPAANQDSDGDGATNLQEFLAGTDPTNADSVLRTKIVATGQGWRLQWNTQPGFIYQVQIAESSVDWRDLGTPRFAAATTDSVSVEGGTDVALYRVNRVR